MATKISHILLLTLTALTTASIYDAPTNRKLEQLRKQMDVLREKLITENCLNTEKTKRSLLDNSSEGVFWIILQMEISWRLNLSSINIWWIFSLPAGRQNKRQLQPHLLPLL